MTWTEPPRLSELTSALHRSHERLRSLLDGASEQLVTQQSYADDWTIAQVASHLGSGAQCFELFIDAGLHESAAPGIEQFQPIWDLWNAKPPLAQVTDAVVIDAALLAHVGSLESATADAWRLDMFGTVQTLSGLMRMRLAEHALHTWDIEVALDPEAQLSPEAAGLILGNLPMLVERAGKPGVASGLRLGLVTTDPDSRLRLDLSGDTARLTPDEAPSTPDLTLPAEAFVRLVYGRLDPDHTPPSVVGDEHTLAALRETFPGV